MKAALIGHFSAATDSMHEATSAAGDQVQRQISAELRAILGDSEVSTIVMSPRPAWPKGPLIVRSKTEDLASYLGYLNLPMFKHWIFAVRMYFVLQRKRPELCIQYNSYLVENLFLVIYRRLRSWSRLALILQDVKISPSESLSLFEKIRNQIAQFALRIARRFDFVVPISAEIIEDFGFDRESAVVFQGGATEFAVRLAGESSASENEDMAVFAGALEAYNGVDKLVNAWVDQGIQLPLHIFGGGSLAGFVKQQSVHSNFIVFHGRQPESVVLAMQRRAQWNFCLRYDLGIDQTYFFPSKLFNIACAPGHVVLNRFSNIPEDIASFCRFLDESLSNLSELIDDTSGPLTSAELKDRRNCVVERHSWQACMRSLLQRAGFTKDKSVLCFQAHYWPGFKAGGALRSVMNVAELIGKRCDFRIVTSDRDLGDIEPYPGVTADVWHSVGNARVRYIRPSFTSVKEAVGQPCVDVLYLNSFFDFWFSILPLVLNRRRISNSFSVVLAPRGEFSPGALRLKSAKKKAFLWVARISGLYRHVIWHASTGQEVRQIAHAIGANPESIVISRDVTLPIPDDIVRNPEGLPEDCLKLCFISRISPKKNLLMAIEITKSLAIPASLDVYGPDDDEAYAGICRDAASVVPEHIRIKFHGAIPSESVSAVFSRYHAFLFPTLGENYGHVIAEALRSGTPVVLSDQTPWQHLGSAGSVLSLADRAGFVAALEGMARMPYAEYLAMREAAKLKFSSSINLGEAADALLSQIFESRQ